jgi:hypothetical protein
LTVEFLSHPAFWIVVAAASELIALSPLLTTASLAWCSKCADAALNQKSADQLSASLAGNVGLSKLSASGGLKLTLPAKLDKAEADWHATQPKAPDPIIVEHPDGGMSIHAPWKRD